MTQMLQKLNATLVKPNKELQLRLTPITRTRNEPFMHCYLGKYKPKLPPASSMVAFDCFKISVIIHAQPGLCLPFYSKLLRVGTHNGCLVLMWECEG